MNYLNSITKETTIEQDEKALKSAQNLYDSMVGTWYRSAVYDDLVKMKEQIEKKKREISLIN